MNLHVVAIQKSSEINIIFGQSHFIKTVEDLHEAMATSVSGAKFAVGFCEASGDRLIRHSGNDPELESLVVENLLRVAAGHTFLIAMSGCFPIQVMRAVRAVPEICSVFCATANDVEVVVAETNLGRGVIGVIDGQVPLGVEGPEQTRVRQQFLRKIGYKF